MVSPGVHRTLLISNRVFSLRAKLAAVPPEPRTVPEELAGWASTSTRWHGRG